MSFISRWSTQRTRSSGHWCVPVVALVVLSSPGLAQNATSLSIISPASGVTVVAEQPVNISVAPSTGALAQAVQLISPAFGLSSPVLSAPYTFSVVFPETSLGPQQVTAMLITGPENAIFSPPVTISVVPASSLLKLATNFASMPFSFIGETARIRVNGIFQAGSSADVTDLPATKFSSQDTAVAKVDSSGQVVATGSGETKVTVQNGSLSVTVAVSVPATVRGDLNGDGKVDQDDFNLLIGAVGQVAAAFDARDLNGDGQIDDKDVGVLRSTCQSTCLPGGHTIPVTGIANAASFVANSVSPGALFSIFTSGLSVPVVSTKTVPFPNSLGGVTVQVGGIGIPLLYVSPTQINAQMPYEVAPGPTTLSVIVNGSSSVAIPLTVAATAPGVFLFQDGRAVVQNQDYSINSTANPANAGSVVVAYFTGQGALDRAISSGDVAPLADLSRPTGVTSATVGGLAAQVYFSGMTPTFVGLAQANIVIPNVPTGDYPLIITVGGSASNAGVISVHAQ